MVMPIPAAPRPQTNFIFPSARGGMLSNPHRALTFHHGRRIEETDALLLVWGCAAIAASRHTTQKGGPRR